VSGSIFFLWNREGLIADLKLRAVALELIMDPALRRADAAVRVIGRRKDITGTKAFQFLKSRGNAVLVDGIDDLF
jgi:hypothetical protein